MSAGNRRMRMRSSLEVNGLLFPLTLYSMNRVRSRELKLPTIRKMERMWLDGQAILNRQGKTRVLLKFHWKNQFLGVVIEYRKKRKMGRRFFKIITAFRVS